MDAIYDQLSNLEVDNFEHRPFVPYTELEQVFTRDTILLSLQQCSVKFYKIQETVSAVQSGGLRVFATLTAIRDIDSIVQFLKVDRSSGSSLDSKLPLTPDNVAHFVKAPLKHQAFLRSQWKFLAPVVSSDQLLRDFHEQTILPFTLRLPLGKNGAFGEVTKVRVDASSHRIPGVKGEASRHQTSLTPVTNAC